MYLCRNIQSNMNNKKGKFKTCPVCNKEFYVMLGQLETRKNCSYKCANIANKNSLKLNCKICGKEYERPVSQVKWRGSNFCSKPCQDKYASIYRVGDKSTCWKGGVSFEGKKITKAHEWANWRKAVFERDDYTCMICGIRNEKGIKVELHPHHIKSYSLHHELRFDVNNGKTLCSVCHHKLHGTLRKGEKIEITRLRIIKKCPGCNNEYEALINQKYCSHKCNERVRRKNAKTHKELSKSF